MTFEELKDKALSLPLAPGVYIMRDQSDRVIYVGKAKKLKNRVSQYFQDTASHSPKTRMMVSKIDRFDVIVAASEFEALVLECSLIKRYLPKYNILLKDDKGYPYLRLNMKDPYPTITMVSKLSDDGGEYFGPYGTRNITNNVMEAIRTTLKLPNCHKQFPRDIGKDRPCLNFHMNQCAGWCQSSMPASEYRQRMEQAKQLLSGHYKEVAADIKKQMLQAAEALDFEQASALRDRLRAVEALGQKQLVTAGSLADTDVVGYGCSQTKACLSVLHFSGGNLLDKDYEIFPIPEDPKDAVSSLLKQYYLSRGIAPKRVLLPFAMEDGQLFSELLAHQFGKNTRFSVPQRGDNLRLVELANKNALEEAKRVTGKEEKRSATLSLLGKLLGMHSPRRIESYDISNISGTDTVASMVVFEDGKAKRSEYKRFQIQGLTVQDDYASMEQVIRRRFRHYLAEDKGFTETPDLLLIDGGAAHAGVALRVLQELNLNFPVFGMVKDNKHRTRALVTSEGREISIDSNQTLFAFIGSIQEETHRFAITYHRTLRSKRLKYSALDKIPGVGPKRKQALLKAFGSISAISQAEIAQLQQILPADAAVSVYHHFHSNKENSFMRVISGKYRGIQLKTPAGMQTRPTADRVKEALFSILQFDIPGTRVLDLFGGTGQLGIEALSRGAKQAVFVDAGEDACKLMRENLKKVHAESDGKVIRSDYLAYLNTCRETFDIVFLDPPYAEVFLENALKKLTEIDILQSGGIIVAERPVGKELPWDFSGFTRSKDYKYGNTLLTLYRKD